MNYVVNTPAQLKPILVGYRKSNGMSQKDMAEKLNVTQQAYQALESNPQAATLDRLMKVLNVLGVKLSLSDTEPFSFSNKEHDTLHVTTYKRVIGKELSTSKFQQVRTKNVPSGKVVKKLNKDNW
jgi:HTH-type transcriptional regulator/antitoxin HipB